MKKLSALIIVISLVLFPKLSFAQEYTVKIDFRTEAFFRNVGSEYRITKLYIVPAGERSWGYEILDGDVIHHGEVMNITNMSSDTPYFDIKAIIVVDEIYDSTTRCLRYIHNNLNAETEEVDFENDFEQVNCN